MKKIIFLLYAACYVTSLQTYTAAHDSKNVSERNHKAHAAEPQSRGPLIPINPSIGWIKSCPLHHRRGSLGNSCNAAREWFAKKE